MSGVPAKDLAFHNLKIVNHLAAPDTQEASGVFKKIDADIIEVETITANRISHAPGGYFSALWGTPVAHALPLYLLGLVQ